MGAGSGSGKGGAGGIPPVLPNQPTSGKGGSNGIPPAQPNQPTLGNQLNPQPPAMGKGGAMPLDYDRRPPAIAQQIPPQIAQQLVQSIQGGKGGASQPQQPRGTMGNTQADYDRMMATSKFAPGASIPTYEEWSASRAANGKGGAMPQQPMQQPMQQPRGTMGTTQADYDRFMATAKFAPGTAPTYEEWSASRAANGKGGAQPQQPMRSPAVAETPVAPVSQGITGLPNIPRGSARPIKRRLMTPAPRRNFRPLTRRGRTR